MLDGLAGGALHAHALDLKPVVPDFTDAKKMHRHAVIPENYGCLASAEAMPMFRGRSGSWSPVERPHAKYYY
jgi:hypothetical protein